LEPIFAGTHDITHGKVASLRRPEYRRKYEQAYNEDLKQYGEELTLDRANKKLLMLRITRPVMLKLWKEHCSGGPRRTLSGTEASLMKRVEQLPCKPLSKDLLLKLNRYLLESEDADANIVVQDPFELGHIAEIIYAEKLPKVRLWIHFKEYLIGGVPDGIADSYVYEFKSTTQTGRRVEAIKDRAVRQALIYAYAFKRPSIRVQIAQFELDKDPFPFKVKRLPRPKISTIDRPVRQDEALTILRDFDLAFQECGKGK
jgi:hypothetical protein